MKSLLPIILCPALATIVCAAPGTLTINGNLTVKQGATVNIEAAGTTPGTQHDEIRVGGGIILINGGTPAGPTLNVTAISGYVGANGDVLDIFDFASLTGTFETINLPLGDWQTTNLATLGELNYQPPGGFLAWLGSNGLASATGDDDNDSLTNITEYALGGIPVAGVGSSSTFLLPSPTIAGVDPNEKFNFKFLLPDAPPSDVKYTIQGHNELTGTWTDLATKTGAAAWTGLATVTTGPSAMGHTAYTLHGRFLELSKAL
jgi:hypothetical protein